MFDFSLYDAECTRCGICTRQQALEGMPEFMCGDLAAELEALCSIEEVSYEAYEFLLSCSLCDACTARCPEGLSCAELVKAGRERLLTLQPQLAASYRPFRVDYRENLFTALREAAGFVYEDALEASQGEHRKGTEGISLFFPGCSLASYSQELTQATFELLRSNEAAQEMSVYCCGKPLSDIGTSEAQARYARSFIARLRQQEVTRLIVACPNCFYFLKEMLTAGEADDIALEPLPQVLSDLGIISKTSTCACAAVHDSCPDRFASCFAEATRALLASSGVEIREMKSSGLDTICCGAGGLAQVGGYAKSTLRCERRTTEFADTGADCLVSSCVSCVNAFLASNEAPASRHYLELLLGVSIDWLAVQKAYDKMYRESGELLALPLGESTKVFDV